MDDLKYYFDNREGFMRKRSNFYAALTGSPDFGFSNFITDEVKNEIATENATSNHVNDDVYEFMV